jgi:putative flippase GtrA
MERKGFFDAKFLKFVFVGIINTIFSTIIMFLLYNLANFGYWGSSAVSYILASILSFFLNKNFTFGNKGSIMKTTLRFSINIAICYLLAYSISKPIVTRILMNSSLSKNIVEQFSMLFGMVLFTMLNYVGQRFFAFKEN